MAAALLLSGCASAGGEGAGPAPVAVASVPGGGADVAGASEAGDEDFRYVPPLPALAATVAAPRVEAFHLAGGQRVAVVERHEVPLVHVAVRVPWAGSSKAGVSTLAGELLLGAKAPGSTRTLGEELRALGAAQGFLAYEEDAFLGFSVTPEALEEALRAVWRGLGPRAALDAETFEEARKRRLTQIEQLGAEGMHDQMRRRIDESLFAPGHPYRVNAEKEVSALRTLKAADVLRQREAALRPEALSVAIVGDVATAAVRAMLAPLAAAPATSASPAGGAREGDGKGPAAGARKASRGEPGAQLARGLFLVEEPGREEVDVAVTLPLRDPDGAELPVTTELRGLIAQVVWVHVNQMLPKRVSQTFSWVRWRREQPLFEFGGRVQPDDAARFVVAVRLGLQMVETQLLTNAVLEALQDDVAARAAKLLGSSEALARTLTRLGDADVTLTRVFAEQDAIRTLPAEALRGMIQGQVRSEEMRVVVVGAADKARPALEALGITPVSARKRAADKAGAKAGDKGAKAGDKGAGGAGR
ncbi:Hypothetical protein CAP_1383 [Chondromyces apiculatus DSM 436]|uniref:Peptidase M16 C-terminal domain-containing protein n=1 Tax=Chondromyces apiculatus DSM 436 TaxID=1192034 RepID=A0A017ST12_9BACT|nr:Hypothetical protein CAP_1383 [Chondromyces apiculatus DSM 436]